MKKTFRITAILLCFCLLAVACQKPAENKTEGESSGAGTESTQDQTADSEGGDVNKDGYPIVNETITVSVSGSKDVTPDWNETILVQEIENKMGIKMDCNPFADDVWETQLTLMIASDELPDLIVNAKLKASDAAKYGGEGYLLPINEYLDEYAPNLKRVLDENPEYKASVTSPDGNIYMLTGLNTNKLGKMGRTFIDNRWLSNVCMEVPTTVDELYDVLLAFRDQDANGNGDPSDEIPLSYVFEDDWYFSKIIQSAFGICSSQPNYILGEDNGEVVLMNTSENYREYLRYMNKLYTENLIDQDIFTHTLEEFRAKVGEGRVGYFGDAAPFVAAAEPVEFDQNFSWGGGLSSDISPEKYIVLDSPATDVGKAAISADTEHPEALVRLLDYFFSDEGSLAGARGFEGLTFEYEEIEGIPGSKVSQVMTVDGYDSSEQFRYSKGVINNGFQFISPYFGTQYPIIIDATEEQLADPLLEKYGWAVLLENGSRRDGVTIVNTFPNLSYTEDESSRHATLKTDMELYLKNARAQFITGELDIDNDWDSFVSTLNQMGLFDLLEIEQGAYDRIK